MAQKEDAKRGDTPQASSSKPRAEPPSRPPATTPQRPQFRISGWWIVFVLALFSLNYYAGSRVSQPAAVAEAILNAAAAVDRPTTAAARS